MGGRSSKFTLFSAGPLITRKILTNWREFREKLQKHFRDGFKRLDEKRENYRACLSDD